MKFFSGNVVKSMTVVHSYIMKSMHACIPLHQCILSAVIDLITVYQHLKLAYGTNTAGTLLSEQAWSLKRALWGKLKNAENKCLLYRKCWPKCAVLVNKWWRGRRPCPAELVSFGQLCVCVFVFGVCMQSWQHSELWPSYICLQAQFSFNTLHISKDE